TIEGMRVVSPPEEFARSFDVETAFWGAAGDGLLIERVSPRRYRIAGTPARQNQHHVDRQNRADLEARLGQAGARSRVGEAERHSAGKRRIERIQAACKKATIAETRISGDVAELPRRRYSLASSEAERHGRHHRDQLLLRANGRQPGRA